MSENSERFRAPDTSHYDDCKGLLGAIRLYRIVRICLVIFFCIASLFVNTIPSFLELTPVSLLTGLFSIPYMAILIVLAMKVKTDDTMKLLRLLVVMAAGTLLQLIHPGAGIAMMLIYVTQFAEMKRYEWLKNQDGFPHFEHYVTIQEYGLEEYHPHHDMNRVKNGGNMPELTAEASGSSSVSRKTAMPPVEGIAEMQAPPKPEMPARPETAVPAAFAGISPMEQEKPVLPSSPVSAASAEIPPMEQKKPARRRKFRNPFLEQKDPSEQGSLPEPEVPAVDFDVPTGIPDPVWDIPDPVMDTSSVLTSFPEIAGDIADLPEIPDIPTI